MYFEVLGPAEFTAKEFPMQTPTQRTRRFGALTLGLSLSLLGPSTWSSSAAASVKSAETSSPVTSRGLQLLGPDDSDASLAPQLSSALHVKVEGPIARAQLIQTFENPSDTTVDAVYRFPLPQTAAVDYFELQIGERRLDGQLNTPSTTAQTYDLAREQKHSVASLEWDSPHWFRVRVANLPPGERVEVHLHYQQEVGCDQGTYSLGFPSSAALETSPNSYAPEPDGPWLQTEVVLAPPGGVLAVSSPSHVLDTRLTALGATRVRMKYGPLLADRDFLLEWQQTETHSTEPRLREEVFRGKTYALVELASPTSFHSMATQAREVHFAIDTSEAMAGENLNQARRALQVALQELTETDLFNVVAFGSSVQPLFLQAQPASVQNIGLALQQLESLRPGGEETLLSALRHVHDTPTSLPKDASSARQVLVFTSASSRPARRLLQFVEAHRFELQLFAVGVGAVSSSATLDLLTELGRGASARVSSPHLVDAQVLDLWNKLSPPVLQRAGLRFEGAPNAEMFPDTLADLWAGERHLIVARLPQENHGLRLNGMLATDRPYRVDAHAAQTQPAAGLHTLWAQRKLQTAMNEQQRSPDAITASRATALQRMALEHRLLSPYSSWLAVDTEPSVDTLGQTVPVRSTSPAGSEEPRPSQWDGPGEPTCGL